MTCSLLVQPLQSQIPYCLCDEVAIDATSLIDSCATQSVPAQALAAVDGKAVVATQAQLGRY